MNQNTSSLVGFRTDLTKLMHASDMRPFSCSGSPLSCQVFIVGFNPATRLDKSFWEYWKDDLGFDKESMMVDYLKKRGRVEPVGVRARIERIVRQLPPGVCLETNICSTPTKKAVQLTRENRTTDIFEHLLRSIRPKLVYVHSDEPIKFFKQFTDKDFYSGVPQIVNWESQEFILLGTPGPLFRMSFDAASDLGQRLAKISITK